MLIVQNGFVIDDGQTAPVVLDSFATAELMADRTEGEITLATHPYLTRELAAATRAIRGVCGWHVAPTRTIPYQRVGRFPWLCFLPAMQIQSIVSAAVNGVPVDPTLVEFDSDTGQTNLYGRAIHVSYSAGFATVPEDIEALTLELAAGALFASAGIIREAAGSVQISYSRSGGGLMPADENRLVPYILGPVP